MRVCPKHWKPAVDTLKSNRDGTEYDLCEVCRQELTEILDGKPEKEEHGRKRVPGRAKNPKK